MTNNRSRFSLRTNQFLNPIPPIRESLSTNSTGVKPPLSPRYRSVTNESIASKSEKQIYTFSNPPRELRRKRTSSLRARVSSAPDENSPRSRLNQPKSSSATGSFTPRSHDDNDYPSMQSNNPIIPISNHHHHHHQQQEKDSLNALMKEQEKSKVPKAVQKRRIVLLFPRASLKQKPNPSSIPVNNQIQSPETPILQTNNPVHHSQPSDNIEAEIADSMQLAAILANIQLQDDWNPNNSSATQPQQRTVLDPSKYEYVVANPLDTATYKLSPRTIKPTEELAARLRFSQHYRSEMRSSANAQIPSLMASIVTENNSTLGNSADIEQTFTFKLNRTNPMNLDENEPIQSTMDNEFVQLCYDATLKRFYDPNTGRYYELTSE
jgi:hypothetical protein